VMTTLFGCPFEDITTVVLHLLLPESATPLMWFT